MGFVIFLAILAIVAVYAVGIYNGLVKLREAVKQAWANIDVLLVQRHDEPASATCSTSRRRWSAS
ncbi:MAG: hypothetical protein H6R27_2009 [Proteobacteria bacterium]|nr:hypothetical protein [Pseudomonadota bacterium]